MSGVVFDAGALIALERDDRAMWAALKLAAIRNIDVVVPSTVVAQVWRGSRPQANLARALDQCVIAAFDPLARRIGELGAALHDRRDFRRRCGSNPGRGSPGLLPRSAKRATS